jgi:hypothetical protein
VRAARDGIASVVSTGIFVITNLGGVRAARDGIASVVSTGIFVNTIHFRTWFDTAIFVARIPRAKVIIITEHITVNGTVALQIAVGSVSCNCILAHTYGVPIGGVTRRNVADVYFTTRCKRRRQLQ